MLILCDDLTVNSDNVFCFTLHEFEKGECGILALHSGLRGFSEGSNSRIIYEDSVVIARYESIFEACIALSKLNNALIDGDKYYDLQEK